MYHTFLRATFYVYRDYGKLCFQILTYNLAQQFFYCQKTQKWDFAIKKILPSSCCGSLADLPADVLKF